MGQEAEQSEVEEEIQEELSLEDLIAEEHPEELPEEVDEDDYLKDVAPEDLKFTKGWNPEFKGPEAKTLNQFIADGKMMGKIEHLNKKNSELQSDFKSRTEKLSKFYDIQLKQKEKELNERFKDAVNMSDIEEVKQVQTELNELNDLKDPEPTNSPGVKDIPQDEIDLANEWDAKNQWLYSANPEHPSYDPKNPDIPKAVFANSLIAKLGHQGTPVAEMIIEVERQIAETFPDEPAKPKGPKTLRSSAGAGSGSRSRGVSWNELTGEELKVYDGMPEGWDSKEEFLQAVTDARKSAGEA
jgi:hypothetical protein